MSTIYTKLDKLADAVSRLIWRMAVAQADRERAKAGETR